ncbi:DUF2867 domain-containing protein [Oxalobacteraceae bacterium OTU3CAMAD1]|nr:DUF2867 domain-containing protein [Oxalobacteraceae bacterium OTU3CAMAD1]
MANEFTLATAVALPVGSGVTRVYKSVDLADAFAIRLPLGASNDPDLLARFIFSHQPSWVDTLLSLRDVIVAAFGLKTSKQLAVIAAAAKTSERVGIFKIYSTNETEIVLGEDDKHLDFRLSVLCSTGAAPDSGRQLTLSTVVHCHNLLGRVYIQVIAPFHRMVVKASLRRAAEVGWPRA